MSRLGTGVCVAGAAGIKLLSMFLSKSMIIPTIKIIVEIPK